MSISKLYGSLTNTLSWNKKNEDSLATISDIGTIESTTTFITGSSWGDNYIDDVYYERTTLTSGQLQQINLQSLAMTTQAGPVRFGFKNIKTIGIINESTGCSLTIGSSGVTNATTFLGISSSIGTSGLLSWYAPSGVTLDVTRSTIGIYNPNSQSVTYNLGIMGQRIIDFSGIRVLEGISSAISTIFAETI